MTADNDEYQDHEEHEVEHGLVMPFVGVASKGGSYDDDAYVGGYEAGLLDARLQYEHPPFLTVTVHNENLTQLDLIAMHRGYEMRTNALSAEGWTEVSFALSGGGLDA